MIGRLLKLCIAITFLCFQKAFSFFFLILPGKQIPPAVVIITYHPLQAGDTHRFEKQMAALLKIGHPVSLNDNLKTLNNGINIAVTFDDAYQSVFHNAIPVLQRHHIPATIFVPSGYLGKSPEWITNPDHPYATEMVMTEDQLKSLPVDLITIGSHSVSHINFNLTDTTTAEREIRESKVQLENILDKRIDFFAIPYATMNKSFLPLFKEAQYQRVFLNIPTFPATKTDLYLLGRTSIEPTDWPIEYILKMKGAYQWLPLAIDLKKKLLS